MGGGLPGYLFGVLGREACAALGAVGGCAFFWELPCLTGPYGRGRLVLYFPNQLRPFRSATAIALL